MPTFKKPGIRVLHKPAVKISKPVVRLTVPPKVRLVIPKIEKPGLGGKASVSVNPVWKSQNFKTMVYALANFTRTGKLAGPPVPMPAYTQAKPIVGVEKFAPWLQYSDVVANATSRLIAQRSKVVTPGKLDRYKPTAKPNHFVLMLGDLRPRQVYTTKGTPFYFGDMPPSAEKYKAIINNTENKLPTMERVKGLLSIAGMQALQQMNIPDLMAAEWLTSPSADPVQRVIGTATQFVYAELGYLFNHFDGLRYLHNAGKINALMNNPYNVSLPKDSKEYLIWKSEVTRKIETLRIENDELALEQESLKNQRDASWNALFGVADVAHQDMARHRRLAELALKDEGGVDLSADFGDDIVIKMNEFADKEREANNIMAIQYRARAEAAYQKFSYSINPVERSKYFDSSIELMEASIRYAAKSDPFSVYGAFTWAREPEKEDEFYKNLALATLEKGSELTVTEIRRMKDYFVNPSTELWAQMIFSPWNVPIFTAIVASPFRLAGIGIKVMKGIPVSESLTKMLANSALGWLARRTMSSSIAHHTHGLFDLLSRFRGAYNLTDNFLNDFDELARFAAEDSRPEVQSVRMKRWIEMQKRLPGLGRITYDEFREYISSIAGNVSLQEAKMDAGMWRSYLNSAVEQVEKEIIDSQLKAATAFVEDDIARGILDPAVKTEAITAKATQLTDAYMKGANNMDRALEIFSESLRAEWLNIYRVTDGSHLISDSITGGLVRALRHGAGETVGKAAGHTSELAAKFYEHIGDIGGGAFKKSMSVGATALEGTSALAQNVISGWTNWVLSLSPRWVVQNVIDSTHRNLIMGGNLWSSMGELWLSTQRQFADALGFVPIEITQAFAREGIGLSSNAASKILYDGWKPKGGIFSFIGEAFKDARGVRTADVLAGKSKQLKGFWYGAAVGRDVWLSMGRGMSDYSSVVEFSLRLNMFHREYFKALELMQPVALKVVMKEIRDPIIRKIGQMIWRVSDGNATKISAMVKDLQRASHTGKASWSLIINQAVDGTMLGSDAAGQALFIGPLKDQLNAMIDAVTDSGRKLTVDDVHDFMNGFRSPLDDEIQKIGLSTDSLRGIDNYANTAGEISSIPSLDEVVDINNAERLAGLRETITLKQAEAAVAKLDATWIGRSGSDLVDLFDEAVSPLAKVKRVEGAGVKVWKDGESIVIEVGKDIENLKSKEIYSHLNDAVIRAYGYKNEKFITGAGFSSVYEYVTKMKSFMIDPTDLKITNPQQFMTAVLSVEGDPLYRSLIQRTSPALVENMKASRNLWYQSAFDDLILSGRGNIDVYAPGGQALMRALDELAASKISVKPPEYMIAMVKSGTATGKLYDLVESGKVSIEFERTLREFLGRWDGLRTSFHRFGANVFPGSIHMRGKPRQESWNLFFDMAVGSIRSEESLKTLILETTLFDEKAGIELMKGVLENSTETFLTGSGFKLIWDETLEGHIKQVEVYLNGRKTTLGIDVADEMFAWMFPAIGEQTTPVMSAVSKDGIINLQEKIVRSIRSNYKIPRIDAEKWASVVYKDAEDFVRRGKGTMDDYVSKLGFVKTKPSDYKGYQVIYDVSKEVGSDGEKLAIYINKTDGTIVVDKDLLKQQFVDKVWNNSDLFSGKPLPKGQFRSYEKWEEFNLRKQSAKLFDSILPTESLSSYENRMTNAALEAMAGKTRKNNEILHILSPNDLILKLGGSVDDIGTLSFYGFHATTVPTMVKESIGSLLDDLRNGVRMKTADATESYLRIVDYLKDRKAVSEADNILQKGFNKKQTSIIRKAFEDYLVTGQAPDIRLQRPFYDMKKRLSSVYGELKGSDAIKDMSKKTKGILEKLSRDVSEAETFAAERQAEVLKQLSGLSPEIKDNEIFNIYMEKTGLDVDSALSKVANVYDELDAMADSLPYLTRDERVAFKKLVVEMDDLITSETLDVYRTVMGIPVESTSTRRVAVQAEIDKMMKLAKRRSESVIWNSSPDELRGWLSLSSDLEIPVEAVADLSNNELAALSRDIMNGMDKRISSFRDLMDNALGRNIQITDETKADIMRELLSKYTDIKGIDTLTNAEVLGYADTIVGAIKTSNPDIINRFKDMKLVGVFEDTFNGLAIADSLGIGTIPYSLDDLALREKEQLLYRLAGGTNRLSLADELDEAWKLWAQSELPNGLFPPRARTSSDAMKRYLNDAIRDNQSYVSKGAAYWLTRVDEFERTIINRYARNPSKILAPSVPDAMISEGMKAWMGQRNALMSTLLDARETLNLVEDFMVKAVENDGVIFERLSAAQLVELEKFSDVAVPAKTDMVSKIIKDALKKTNDAMLDYGYTSNLDSIMRNVFPFWKFPSRSVPFWAKTLATHPEIIAAYERIRRFSNAQLRQAGALTSSGEILPSLDGYVRVPGTKDMWVNPMAPLSFRYVLDWAHKLNPYKFSILDPEMEETDPLTFLARHTLDSSQIFGFTPGPWVSMFLRRDNAFPLVPQISLMPRHYIPEVIFSTRMRVFGSWFKNGIPTKVDAWYPQNSGHDYIVENKILSDALAKIQNGELTDDRDITRLINEVKDAISKKGRGRYELDADGKLIYEKDDMGNPVLDENGNPIPVKKYSKLWTDTYNAVSNDEASRAMMAFFTGFYAKPFNEEQAALLKLRDENGMLKSAMNNEFQTELFDLPEDVDERYSYYNNNRRTPDGQINTMRTNTGWITDDNGLFITDDDERTERMALMMEQQELSDRRYVELARAQRRLNEGLSKIPIGSNWEAYKPFYDRYDAELNTIYKEYTTTYERKMGTNRNVKTIEEELRNIFFRSIISSRPAWDVDGGEDFKVWEKRVKDWNEKILPNIYSSGKRMENFMSSRMVEDVVNSLHPDQKLSPTFWSGLVQEVQEYGTEKWKLDTDNVFDALNRAYDDIYRTPYYDAMQDDKGEWLPSYMMADAQEKFADTHPVPSTQQMYDYIVSVYGSERFTYDDVADYYEGAGVTTVEDANIATKGEAYKLKQDIFKNAGYAGPGKGVTQFGDAMAQALGELDPKNEVKFSSDTWDAWYATGGELYGDDVEKLKWLFELVKRTNKIANLPPPTSDEIRTFAIAQDQNNEFKKLISEHFADRFDMDFYRLMDVYYGQSYDGQKAWRKANQPAYIAITKEYPKLRKEYGESNAEWSQYYLGTPITSTTKVTPGSGVSTAFAPLETTTSPIYVTQGTIHPRQFGIPKVDRDGRVTQTPPPTSLPFVSFPSGMYSMVGNIVADEIRAVLAGAGTLSSTTRKYLEGLAQRYPKWAAFIATVLSHR